MKLVNFNTAVPNIIVRMLTGQPLTEQERADLEKWVADSDENRALFEKITSGVSLTEYNNIRSLTSTDNILARIETRKRRSRLRRLIVTIGSAAAVLIATLIIFSQLIPYGGDKADGKRLFSPGMSKAILTVGDKRIELTGQDGETTWEKYVDGISGMPESADVPEQVRIETPRGGEYKLRLPDGTSVWLNAETVIEYPKAFTGDKRKVRISGEAFFDVTHNPARPFVVTTGDNLEVTVLGTQFNVNNYAEDDQTTIALVKGGVKVRSGNDHVVLSPLHRAVFDKAKKSLSVTEVEDIRVYTAWTEGEFCYRGTSLNRIFAALERWYNVRIDYSGADISTIGDVTLIFSRRDNLESVLEALKAMTGLRYEIADTPAPYNIIIKN